MKYTDNLNLKKPEQTEFYNVDDFNENADKLDNAINGLNTRVTPIEKGGTGATTAGDACTNLGAQEKAKLYKTMTAEDVSKAGWGFADESLEVKDDTTFHNVDILKVVRSGSTTDSTNTVIPWVSSNALVFGRRETTASIGMNFNSDNPAVRFTSGNTKPKWAFTIKGANDTEYDLSNYYSKPQIDTKLSGVWEIKRGGTGANNAADACKNLGIVDMIYPVGSLYWSKKPTNPEELFGGKWTQIKDKFILAAGDTYNAGATGGEAKHQLTADEMPTHVHSLAFGTTNVSFSFSIRSQSKNAANVLAGTNTTVTRREHNRGNAVEPSSAGSWYRDELSFNKNITPTGTMNSTGGNRPHNNMPPYVTYYCWERTA